MPEKKFGNFDSLEELLADYQSQLKLANELREEVKGLKLSVGEIESLKSKISELQKVSPKKTGLSAKEKLDKFEAEHDPTDMNKKEQLAFNRIHYQLMRDAEEERKTFQADQESENEKKIRDKVTKEFSDDLWKAARKKHAKDHDGKEMTQEDEEKLESYCKKNGMLPLEGLAYMQFDEFKSESAKKKEEKNKEHENKKKQEVKDRVHKSPDDEDEDDTNFSITGRDGRRSLAGDIKSNTELNELFAQIENK